MHNIAHELLLRETTGFAGYVCDGAAGRGKQVGFVEVSKALSAINTSIEMDSGRLPLFRNKGKYFNNIGVMLDGFQKMTRRLRRCFLSRSAYQNEYASMG